MNQNLQSDFSCFKLNSSDVLDTFFEESCENLTESSDSKIQQFELLDGTLLSANPRSQTMHCVSLQSPQLLEVIKEVNLDLKTTKKCGNSCYQWDHLLEERIKKFLDKELKAIDIKEEKKDQFMQSCKQQTFNQISGPEFKLVEKQEVKKLQLKKMPSVKLQTGPFQGIKRYSVVKTKQQK